VELSEKAEEILETVWIRTEEENQSSVAVADVESEGNAPLEELQGAGCITLTGGNIKLTQRGWPLAENVVRRHRLAERLLTDVLDAWNETNHEKACKFEHLLDRGLDDSICSLLGHPKVCPHGKPIPPGKCCLDKRESSTRLVSPLSQLVEGQTGKVAYIYAPKLSQLQKLTAMGILPGAPITIIQRFPAHVFQVGHTQFAVDREIADAIYIRLMEAEEKPVEEEESPQPKRRGFGWGRRLRPGQARER
jgi:DtxR family Mn-dependent transcriptional regulator